MSNSYNSYLRKPFETFSTIMKASAEANDEDAPSPFPEIIMFDMDNTLTPASAVIEPEMIPYLERLISKGFKLGIVTGAS